MFVSVKEKMRETLSVKSWVVILTPVDGGKMTSQTIGRKVKARKEYGDIVFPCEHSGDGIAGAEP